MKEPEIKTWTLRQCAEMLASKAWGRTDEHFCFSTTKDQYGPEMEKCFGENEKILKKAVKNKQLSGMSESGELNFVTIAFYDWAKENGFSFNSACEDMLKKNIDETKEAIQPWEFYQRHQKTCLRKIKGDKLALLLREPLWELHKGLMLLDGFEPYESLAMNAKCIDTDERMSRLYQCVLDANKISESLIEDGEIDIPNGQIVIYKIRPKDLVELIASMGAKLQLLFKAQEYFASIKSESKELNHKRKITYLTIIYVFLKKHLDKYDPNKNNNETQKINEILENAGHGLDKSVIKSVLDECYERFIIKNTGNALSELPPTSSGASGLQNLKSTTDFVGGHKRSGAKPPHPTID